MENKKKKILFVCTVNKMRSLTAQEIFKDSEKYEVKSAGTDKSATQVINEELINWADTILVMEKSHRNYIRNKFYNLYKKKTITCMYIPDEYDYMSKDLISILKNKMKDLEEKKLI